MIKAVNIGITIMVSNIIMFGTWVLTVSLKLNIREIG